MSEAVKRHIAIAVSCHICGRLEHSGSAKISILPEDVRERMKLAGQEFIDKGWVLISQCPNCAAVN